MPSCATCNNRYFATREALQQHFKNSPRHPYCDTCSRDFVNAHALEQHLKNSPVHAYCSKCDRSFASFDSLQRHLSDSPKHQSGRRRSRNRSRSGSANSTPTSSVYRLTYPWSCSPSPITYPETPSSATATATGLDVSSPKPISPPALIPQQLHVHIPSTTDILQRSESVTSDSESSSADSVEGQSEAEDQVPELRQPKVPLRDVVLPSDISTPITPLLSSESAKATDWSPVGALRDAILPTDVSTPVTPAAISTLQRAMDNSSPTPTSATSMTLVMHFSGQMGEDKEVEGEARGEQDQEEEDQQEEHEQEHEHEPALGQQLVHQEDVAVPAKEEEQQRQTRLLVNGENVVLQSDISTPVTRGRERLPHAEEDDDDLADERHNALDVDEQAIGDSQITIRPSRIPTMHSPDPSPAPSSRASPIPSTSRSPPPRPPRSHLRASAASPSPSFSLCHDHDNEHSHSQVHEHTTSPQSGRRVALRMGEEDREREMDPHSNVTSPDMRFEELQGLPRFSGMSEQDDDDTSPLASQFEQDIRRYSTPLLEAEELGSDHGDEGRERMMEMEYGDERDERHTDERYDFEYDRDFGLSDDQQDGETGSPHIALPFLSQDPYLLAHVSPPYSTPLARRRPSSIHSSSSAPPQVRTRPTQSQAHHNRNARIVGEQAYVCDLGDEDGEFEDGAGLGRGESEPRTVSFFARFAPPERHAHSEVEWGDEHYDHDAEEQYDYDDEYDEEGEDGEIPFIASGIQVGPGHDDDGDAESSTPMLLTLCSRGPSFFRYPYPFQLSLPPIPEREHMEEHEELEDEEEREECGASIHTMDSDEEREMARGGVYRQGGEFVRTGGVAEDDGIKDEDEDVESPVTELALPSPPSLEAQLSAAGEDDASDGEESVACPSPLNFSPLQSPRLDQLARAICNELSTQDAIAGADANADVDDLDLNFARSSPVLGFDVNDEMDIMRINIDDAIDYYEDNVVEDEGDPFTDLARISLSLLSETDDTYGYSYSYANSPVDTPATEVIKKAGSSSPTDEFFSARDSLVDTTPLAGMMDDEQHSDPDETMVVERVSKALSLLQQTEDVSPRLARPHSWVDYPELPPSKRSSSRESGHDSLNGGSSAHSSPSLRATRSIPAMSTQPHSRSNSSRSVSPQAFLISLGMYGNSNSGRTTPEAALAPEAARGANRESLQDFLDLESTNPSPQMFPLPIESDSEEVEEYADSARAPHIRIDIVNDQNVTPEDLTSTPNVAGPSNGSPNSPYVQQTPISVRTSYLQDHSGIPTPGDIPSEESSLNWMSAKTLREACLKRAVEEHSRGSSVDMESNTMRSAPKIVAPLLCERVESLPIPTSAADTDFLKDEPSIIGSIPSSPVVAAREVQVGTQPDTGDSAHSGTAQDQETNHSCSAHSSAECVLDKPNTPRNTESSADVSTGLHTETECESSLPAPRQATSVMHCRICRADPCIETTATFCGHIFCYDCITREVIATSKCPVCRTPTLLYCLFKLDLSC